MSIYKVLEYLSLEIGLMGRGGGVVKGGLDNFF